MGRYESLRARLRGRGVADEVVAEFEHHVEMRIADNIASGMTPDTALEEAMRRFGDWDRFRRETQAIDEQRLREGRRLDAAATAFREVGNAFRSLVRDRSFTWVAGVALALGIGATTAIWTVVRSVLIDPLPYPAADRLVRLDNRVPGVDPEARWDLAPAGFFYYREHARTLDGIAVYRTYGVNVLGEGGPAERVIAGEVSGDLFEVLRARPALGRLLTRRDDEPLEVTGTRVIPGPAEPVIVLSHEFWTRRFGADPAVIGATMTVRGVAMPIVGVAEAGFDVPGADVDVWIPMGLNPAAPATSWHQFAAIGRLADGRTVESAQAELTALTSRFPALHPNVYGADFMGSTGFAVEVRSLHETVVGGVAGQLWMLLAAVGVVLLIACVDVANLYIVRAETRVRDTAIRTALGAGRGRLAVQSIAESLVLATVSAAIGVALAYGAIQLFLGVTPTWIPRFDDVALGWPSVAFAAVLAVVAGVLFGLIPLAHTGSPARLLQEGGRRLTGSVRRQTVRAVLVVGQIAFTLMLLAAAGLMVQSFFRLRSVDSGIQVDRVLTMQVALQGAKYQEPEPVSAFYQELLTRVAALPDVVAAGATTDLPVANPEGPGACTAVWFEDRGFETDDRLRRGRRIPDEGGQCASVSQVAPGYFQALGIPVQGTVPDWSDVERQTGAVVVSRSFAERFWPGQDPIGKGLRGNGNGPPYYRVVGVAGEVRANGLDAPPPEHVYFPPLEIEGTRGWGPPNFMTLVVRGATADVESLVAPIRAVAGELDPEVPIANVRTMEQVMAASLARTRLTMMLLAIAAAMALVLSAVGIYGVVSYVVSRRTAEIGVRIALGARIGQVLRLVLGHSARLAVAGVALGLVGALVVTRVLRTLLFEVSPTDPFTLAGVALLLVAVALLASYIPARRASAIDPVEALRSE